MKDEFDEEGRWLASGEVIGVFRRGSSYIRITRGDAACLDDGLWLNDAAIDLGIQLIIDAELNVTEHLSDSQPQTLPVCERVYAFSVYFSIRLRQVPLAVCLPLHAFPAT